MTELLYFISAYVIEALKFMLLANVVLSWLITLGVVNPYNQLVRSIWQGLEALFSPLLRPIRAFLPSVGGLDFSPLVLYFALIFVQVVIIPNIAKLFA